MCAGGRNHPCPTISPPPAGGFSESAQNVFTNADEYVNKTLVNWATSLRRRDDSDG